MRKIAGLLAGSAFDRPTRTLAIYFSMEAFFILNSHGKPLGRLVQLPRPFRVLFTIDPSNATVP